MNTRTNFGFNDEPFDEGNAVIIGIIILAIIAIALFF